MPEARPEPSRRPRYPTLSALAGLPDPLSVGEMLNGTSLEPVFDESDDPLYDTRQRRHIPPPVPD
eukprot:COSAG05_NODE_1731_length_4186_cov_471.477857_3_plen_65_part_00